MGNLLTSLVNASNALGVYNQALQTTENNIVNAQTPDYAKQVQQFTALPFDPAVGLPGGVASGGVESTRNAFAEESVRTQQSQTGFDQQVSTDLTSLQNYFTVPSATGTGTDISSSLNSLWSAFSQLSVNPNDTASRQAVLNQAQQVAKAFNATASGLASTSGSIQNQAQSTVQSINALAADIAAINTHRAANATSQVDAGVDASLNSDLEQLSQYVNFKALQQPDGSVTVYLGGQTPLVMGDQSMPIEADSSSGQISILDSQGRDITSEVQTGQLAGMLQVNNTAIPSYTTDLNTLAQSVADQVNTTLANGVDENGNAPSTDLFTYDPTVGAAQTLTTNALTPDQIAAAASGAPGGNGNALALAQLGSSTPVNGYSFATFYGNLAGRVGSDISNANANATSDNQLLTQAQTLRSNISGVTLDGQAAQLLTFQRAYQATSELISVLDSLTNTVINIIPQGASA